MGEGRLSLLTGNRVHSQPSHGAESSPLLVSRSRSQWTMENLTQDGDMIILFHAYQLQDMGGDSTGMLIPIQRPVLLVAAIVLLLCPEPLAHKAQALETSVRLTIGPEA